MKKTYSISTLRRKAEKAGYTFSKGYRHYMNPEWGFLHDCNGDRIAGYMLFDNSRGHYVWPCYNDLWDYALSLEEIISLMGEMGIL